MLSSPRVLRLTDNARMTLALSLLSAWLVLLMIGQHLGGAAYLLFVGALALFPWRVFR